MKQFMMAAMVLVFYAVLVGSAAASESQSPASDQSAQIIPGNMVNEKQNIPGRDLRSRRGYSAGLINEKEKLYVLYFLFDNGHMRFYRNEEHMTPILTVDLASNPQATVGSIVFEDVNGDGYNDLRIPFPGDKWQTWLWVLENMDFADTVME